jgi:hypothetical protein
LWTGGTGENALAADPSRARAAGLSTRPLEQTISDTWEWLRLASPEPPPQWGTPTEQEARLLEDWHAERTAGPGGAG